MYQRERRSVPGSSNTLFVHLDDITASQVFVEVFDFDGRYMVERTSLKNDEFLKFQVNENEFYLQVIDMVNHLVGQDLCKVRISSKKPKVPPKDGQSKESRRK